MTHIETAVDLVQQFGQACVEDILPECEGMTRAQAMKALDNAVHRGLLKSVGLSDKLGTNGRRMTLYSPTGKVMPSRPLPPRGEYGHIGKVSSVFAMGQQ